VLSFYEISLGINELTQHHGMGYATAWSCQTTNASS